MNLDERLEIFAEKSKRESIDTNALAATIRASKEAFRKAEAEQILSWHEFLYLQMLYVKKLWWVLQAGVLLLLWLFLNLSESDYYTRRCLGLTAPVFVILILPELWKNDTNRSFEVESAALFNLQKIVAARILLFSMVDLVLLTAFFTVSVTFLGISFMDLIVQFLIPMLVTCCICLRMFGGKCNRSLLPPVAACLFWLAVWTQVVLREDVYCKISVPVWMGVLTLSLCCLCYCAARMLKNVEFNYSYNS